MSEIIDALNQLEREKSVSKELVMEAIEKSLVAACEKDYGKNVLVEAHMDRETGAITVVRKKEVVEEVENDENQITHACAVNKILFTRSYLPAPTFWLVKLIVP